MLHNLQRSAQTGRAARTRTRQSGAHHLGPNGALDLGDETARSTLDDVLQAFRVSVAKPPSEDDWDSEEDTARVDMEKEAQEREAVARKIKCWIPPHILHSASPFKTTWDVLLLVIILYSLWMIPFRIGFAVIPGPWLTFTDVAMDLFFFADIILNFFVGFHDQFGVFVYERKPIAIRYLCTWFTIDLLSTVPIDTVVGWAVADDDLGIYRTLRLFRVLRLFRLLKLARLAKMRKTLAKLEAVDWFNTGVLRLVGLMAQVLFIAHFFACFWHFIPDMEEGPESWFDKAGIVESTPTITRYTTSLYWSTKTMMSVGYGDLHAITTVERLYSVITQIVGVSVFGFLVANISSLLETINVRAVAYRSRMSEVREYLHDRKLPLQLQQRILRFFSHLWKNKSLFDESGILDELPSSLRNEVVKHGRSSIIANVSLLYNEDDNLVALLVSLMTPLAAESESILAKRNQTADQMFFVMQGVVEAFVPRPAVAGEDSAKARKHREVVAVYAQGDHFGHIDLIHGTSRGAGLRALTHCSLQTLTKESLLRGLYLFPDFRVKVERHALMHHNLLIAATHAVHERFEHPHLWALRELPVVYKDKLTLRSMIPGYFHARQIARTHKLQVQASSSKSSSGASRGAASRAMDSTWAAPAGALLRRMGSSARSSNKSRKSAKGSPAGSGIHTSDSGVDGNEDGEDEVKVVRCRVLNPLKDSFCARACCCGVGMHGRSWWWCPRRRRAGAEAETPSFQHVNSQKVIKARQRLKLGMGLAAAHNKRAAPQLAMVGPAVPRVPSTRSAALKVLKTADLSEMSPDPDKVVALRGDGWGHEQKHLTAEGKSKSNRSLKAGGDSKHSVHEDEGDSPPALGDSMLNQVVAASPSPTQDTKPGPALSWLKSSDSNASTSDSPVFTLKDRAAAIRQAEGISKDKLMNVANIKDMKAFSKDAADLAFTKRAKDVMMNSGQLASQYWLILGSSGWRVGWDLLVMAATILSVIITPVRIAFEQDAGSSNSPTMFILELILDSMFAIDMLTNFRTTYWSTANEFHVAVPSRVALNYLKGWFTVDLLATFPFELVATAVIDNNDSTSLRIVSVMRMLRLLKLARLARLSSMVDNLEGVAILSMAPALFRLFKLLFQISFGAHLLGCMWFFVGTLDPNDLGWWQPVLEAFPPGWNVTLADKYVASLYWAFTTITTVGYGDIVPTNDGERIVAILVMLLGATVFGYVIGSVTALVGRLNTRAERRDMRINQVKEYLNEIHAPRKLRDRVLAHYEFLYSVRSVYDEDTILESLPASLAHEVVLFNNRSIISKISFFRSSDDVFIAHMVRLLHPIQAHPFEEVFRKGDVGLEMFFIIRGVAEVIAQDATTGEELVIKVLHDGEFFGELALLMNSRRTATVRARTMLQMYSLSKEAIATTLAEYPSLGPEIRAAMEDAANRLSRKRMTEVKEQVLAEKFARKWKDKVTASRKRTRSLSPVGQSPTSLLGANSNDSAASPVSSAVAHATAAVAKDLGSDTLVDDLIQSANVEEHKTVSPDAEVPGMIPAKRSSSSRSLNPTLQLGSSSRSVHSHHMPTVNEDSELDDDVDLTPSDSTPMAMGYRTGGMQGYFASFKALDNIMRAAHKG